MIDHFNLPVRDLARSRRFYERVLEPLGFAFLAQDGSAVGFGSDTWRFGIVATHVPVPSLHVAFAATHRDAVDRFFEAGTALGARGNGPPGVRPRYDRDYYAAFVLDPDGHNIEAVCRQPVPRDNEACRLPVSVKGVVIRGGCVVLLENERDEWELPGGKLEPSEPPQVCVAREIAEELRLQVRAEALLDTWVYSIAPEVRVLIVTYGCRETAEVEAVLSHEHKRLAWFPLAQVPSLRMPEGYKASIRAWALALGLPG